MFESNSFEMDLLALLVIVCDATSKFYALFATRLASLIEQALKYKVRNTETACP